MLTIDSVLKCNIADYSNLIELHNQNMQLIEEQECPKWLFRGVRNCKWGIKTSFETHYPEESLKNIAEIRGVPSEEIKKSFLKIIDTQANHGKTATKQHYGVPTESLDWTEDLYVAIYFALTSFLTYFFEEHRNWYSSLKYCQSGCNSLAKTEEHKVWQKLHDEWKDNGEIPAILVLERTDDLADCLTSHRDNSLKRMKAQKGWLMDLSSLERRDKISDKICKTSLGVSSDMLALLFHELWKHKATSVKLFQEDGMEKSIMLRIAFETLNSKLFFEGSTAFTIERKMEKAGNHAHTSASQAENIFIPSKTHGTIENLIKNYGESEILRGQ